jgi:hypothetical protein
MNRKIVPILIALMLGVIASTQLVHAQNGAIISGEMIGGDPGPRLFRPYPTLGRQIVRGAMDVRKHPAPFYAHSSNGIDATRTHNWNMSQAMSNSWHANYYYPQYGAPLALVVPPTASFQSVYSWGVGRTQSLPIYDQFGLGAGSGMVGGGGYNAPPYWPSNTNQFGVYPVRGPW